jgi:hypothetical protein
MKFFFLACCQWQGLYRHRDDDPLQCTDFAAVPDSSGILEATCPIIDGHYQISAVPHHFRLA